MRKKIAILLITPYLLIGVIHTTFGQKTFEGMATYRSSRQIEPIDLERKHTSPKIQEAIRKQLIAQSQRDYTLTFNLQESVWEEKAKLKPETPTTGTGNVKIQLSGGSSVSYLNPIKNQFLEEKEIFGKKFLIEDDLPKFHWKITNETKKIGQYTAVKAEHLQLTQRVALSVNNSDQTPKMITDTTLMTAWYAPEIPVSQGPSGTWGLPGLILELKNGSITYLCTKVVLNPTTPVTIHVPNKGKRITRKEAKQIRDEKLLEMMKKYDTGEGGEQHIIRIGG